MLVLLPYDCSHHYNYFEYRPQTSGSSTAVGRSFFTFSSFSSWVLIPSHALPKATSPRFGLRKVGQGTGMALEAGVSRLTRLRQARGGAFPKRSRRGARARGRAARTPPGLRRDGPPRCKAVPAGSRTPPGRTGASKMMKTYNFMYAILF